MHCYACLHVYDDELTPTRKLQILAFTADNASNNNTLVDELGDLLDGFQGPLT
jgi:hypothetical protein